MNFAKNVSDREVVDNCLDCIKLHTAIMTPPRMNKKKIMKHVAVDSMQLGSTEKQQSLGPINNLPSELIDQIFAFLDHVDMLRTAQVSHLWRELMTVESLWKGIFYRELVFYDEKKWAQLGDIGEIPTIDSYRKVSLKALQWAHLKWPKEWDRKMLFLAPKDILPKGKSQRIPLTAIEIGKLIAPKLGKDIDQTGYEIFWDNAKQAHGNTALKESSWIYMTPDVIPQSKNRNYDAQVELLEEFGGKVPSVTTANMCIFLKADSTGKRLLPGGHSQDQIIDDTYTSCEESVGNMRIVTGGSVPQGVQTALLSGKDRTVGMAACIFPTLS